MQYPERGVYISQVFFFTFQNSGCKSCCNVTCSNLNQSTCKNETASQKNVRLGFRLKKKQKAIK